MTTLRTAAQQALEALELGYDSAKAEADQYHAAMAGYRPQRHAQMDADVQQIASAITALRAALAEPVQEPVAIVGRKGYGGQWAPPGPPIKTVHMLRELPEGMLLYTAPPQRKPLTENEIKKLLIESAGMTIQFSDVDLRLARAIERAHGIT